MREELFNKKLIQAQGKRVIEEFNNALIEGDSFLATKLLGIMEFIGIPCLQFYTGELKMAEHKYDEAIVAFKSISIEEPLFPNAMQHLLSAYCAYGRYIEWNELLSKGYTDLTPIQEMNDRIICLVKMDLSEFCNHDDQIQKMESQIIKALPDSQREKYLLYSVVNYLMLALVTAGDMINRCSNYKRLMGEIGIDFNNNNEVKFFVNTYNKMIRILELSEALNFLRFKGDISSLAQVVLSDKPWGEKIDIFRTGICTQNVQNTLFSMCSPKMFPYINRYDIILGLLDKMVHVNPLALQPIILHYYDDIINGVKAGDSQAFAYLCLIYGDIIASGEDKYELKDKLEEVFANASENEVQEMLKKRKRGRKMSEKGYAALQNAETAFSYTSPEQYNTKDASVLALMYFRVIEIEFNERMISPFLEKLDINILKGLTNCNPTRFMETREKDARILEDAKRNLQSIEIGKIRNLIKHYSGRYDRFSIFLNKQLEQVLTDKGQDMYDQGIMATIIEKSKVDAYRNPGAHTGFLPYSKACEARDYVIWALDQIQEWFVIDKN